MYIELEIIINIFIVGLKKIKSTNSYEAFMYGDID